MSKDGIHNFNSPPKNNALFDKNSKSVIKVSKWHQARPVLLIQLLQRQRKQAQQQRTTNEAIATTNNNRKQAKNTQGNNSIKRGRGQQARNTPAGDQYRPRHCPYQSATDQPSHNRHRNRISTTPNTIVIIKIAISQPV